MKSFLTFILFVFLSSEVISQRKYVRPEFVDNWSKSGRHPDHIVLNFSEDPSTSVSVTWRTNRDVVTAYGEIAKALPNPAFIRRAKTYDAETETTNTYVVDVFSSSNPNNSKFNNVQNNYHSVTFRDLEPNTLYGYRVGDGEIWSEWIQFRTAHKEEKPFSFLYVGDAQNYILELWSRLIREGYRKAPDARFIIHAGDLVDEAHNENEWHQWFMAGGYIHRTLPSLMVPGNHEYNPISQQDINANRKQLSYQWKKQFTLPNNGVRGIQETNYYIDFQGVRFIFLNSNERIRDQAKWLEQILASNTNKWIVASFHHPIFSASTGRDNSQLRKQWKPIFDKYRVDIVLQGHDHTYTRGRVQPYEQNLLSGQNVKDATGTVYVVSVSGAKMYKVKPGWEQYEALRDRVGVNKQLFQVISIDDNKLFYKSYTADGELFDAFDLVKNNDGVNIFVERKNEAL